MHTLTKPQADHEILPLLGRMVDNLRKLSNLSGTGCTINELPGGLSINVPPAPQQDGFWAMLGVKNNDNTIKPTTADDYYYHDPDHPSWYHWFEVENVADPADAAGLKTIWQPLAGGRVSRWVNYEGKRIIIDRAREVSDFATAVPGTVVWLTTGLRYNTVDPDVTSVSDADKTGQEYLFNRAPRFILASITGRATKSFDQRPYYQWKEMEFVVDPADTNNAILQDRVNGLCSTIDDDGYVSNPAVEYTRFAYVPTGQVVMLEDTGLKVSLPTSGNATAAGTVYGFYQPYKELHFIGTLQSTLSSSDGAARVKLYKIDGSTGPTEEASNLLGYAGTAGDTVACIIDYRESPSRPYMLLAVKQTPITIQTDSSYDTGTGILSKTTIQAAVAQTGGSSSTATVLAFAAPGSDLQRIDTTTGLAASATTIVTGQSVTFTATVTKASGTADPTGVVLFASSVYGSLGTAAVVSGTTATLTVNYPTSATAGSDTVTAMYQGDSSFNGSNSTSGGSMTLNKADTSTNLTASTTTPTYGDSIDLTATVTAASPGSGSPSGAVTFKDGSDVLGVVTASSGGVFVLTTRTIKAGSRSLSAEYTVPGAFGVRYNSSTGTLSATVAKAHLTITANDQARKYGDANAFTAKYDGWKNGDTASSALTGAVALTSTADATSDVGSYAITAAAGTLAADNYDWPSGYFHAGTLTVTHAPIYCTAANKSMAKGGTVPAFTGTITGIRNSDTITASYSCSGDGSTVGSFAIVPSLSGSKLSNYTQSLTSGTLTVS